MQEALVGAIRITHILTGVAMAGGAVFWSFVIMPGVQKKLLPPVQGAFLGAVFGRVARYLDWATYAALATGLLLLGSIVGFGSIVPLFLSGSYYGMVLLAALVMLLVTIVLSNHVIKPSAAKLLAMSPEAPLPPTEIGRLQKRLAVGSLSADALAILILVMMALAVNARA